MSSVAPAPWYCGQNLGVFQSDLPKIQRALGRVDFIKRTKVGAYTVLDRAKDPKFPDQGKYKQIFYCVHAPVLYGAFKVFVAARESIHSPQFKKEKRVIDLLKETSAIVPTLYVGVVEQKGYIVSELFNRGSLARVIEQPDFLGASLSTHLLAYAIVCALGECHVRGIVLRDLKASNILVRELVDGSLDARLTDFGMAYIKEEDSKSEATRSCGSPLYLSGEERNRMATTGSGFPADFSRDLRALGCVMHGLATTKMPPDLEEDLSPSLGLFKQEIIDLVYLKWGSRPPHYTIQERMFTLLKKTFPNGREVESLAFNVPATPSSPKLIEELDVTYTYPENPVPPEPKKPTLSQRLYACFCCCFAK